MSRDKKQRPRKNRRSETRRVTIRSLHVLSPVQMIGIQLRLPDDTRTPEFRQGHVTYVQLVQYPFPQKKELPQPVDSRRNIPIRNRSRAAAHSCGTLIILALAANDWQFHTYAVHGRTACGYTVCRLPKYQSRS